MTPRHLTCGAVRWSQIIVLAAACVAGVLMRPAGAVSLPSDLRACVEGNLVRYLPPTTALEGQYADLEAACRSALGDGEIRVGFTASPTTPGSSPGASDPSPSPSPSPSGAEASPSSGAAPAGDPSTGERAPSASASPPSPEVLRVAAGDSALSAGTPFPMSVSDAPAWLFALIAALVAALAVALARAVRRRSA